VRDATGLEGGSAKATRQPPFGLLEGVNFWPREPAGFREAYEEYVVECRKLGEAVLRAMGDALRLQDPDHFVKAVKDSFWVMRAIGYPPLDDALAKTGGVSCGEHSDYGCLTLLLDDGTPGALQVFRRGEREGEGSWVNAEPVKGALVVNVGEMVEKWTGGEVRSTKHRVVHTGKSFRVSVPFFLEPGRDVIVECLDEFKDGLKTRIERGEATADDHKPIRYWDHLVGKVGGNFVETET
jgi:isopenicillin N synthase-like dioxygenase